MSSYFHESTERWKESETVHQSMRIHNIMTYFFIKHVFICFKHFPKSTLYMLRSCNPDQIVSQFRNTDVEHNKTRQHQYQHLAHIRKIENEKQ